ncbi:MAG: hypothetical protein IJS94_02175 [Clostridia bacterium]|nr:hypothetical protein [Clostridia bacterium]
MIFFAAEASSDDLINQESEVASLEWLPLETALEALTFDSDRDVLTKADAYITGRKDG